MLKDLQESGSAAKMLFGNVTTEQLKKNSGKVKKSSSYHGKQVKWKRKQTPEGGVEEKRCSAGKTNALVDEQDVVSHKLVEKGEDREVDVFGFGLWEAVDARKDDNIEKQQEGNKRKNDDINKYSFSSKRDANLYYKRQRLHLAKEVATLKDSIVEDADSAYAASNPHGGTYRGVNIGEDTPTPRSATIKNSLDSSCKVEFRKYGKKKKKRRKLGTRKKGAGETLV
eukprot:g3904.t1